MTNNYDYVDGPMSRPTASRRSHYSNAVSRSFSNGMPYKSGIDPMNRSMYKTDSRDERLNRSSSAAKQYSYKMDQIQNRLAQKNNMLGLI